MSGVHFSDGLEMAMVDTYKQALGRLANHWLLLFIDLSTFWMFKAQKVYLSAFWDQVLHVFLPATDVGPHHQYVNTCNSLNYVFLIILVRKWSLFQNLIASSCW